MTAAKRTVKRKRDVMRNRQCWRCGALFWRACSADEDIPYTEPCSACRDEPVWRTGRRLLRALYRANVCVGMVDTPELAAAIVNAMNARVT